MHRVALIGALLCGATDLVAQPITLSVGRPVRATLARGDTARYRFDADSNVIARVAVDQISANTLVRILSPRGRVLRTVNATPRGLERLHVEIGEQGIQQIEVIPVDSAVGDFSITLVAREVLSKDPRTFAAQLLAPYDRTDGPGAAVAVWRGGRTLFAKGYGMANLAYTVPFTATTPTNIGSTSKQFTAFAVMLLVEQGKLRLDDDVRKHIPELPDLGRTVTVRNLLTHTSGYRELYNGLSLAGRRFDEGDHVDRSEVISIVQHQPALQNAPGAEFNYNNTGFALTALIVERVSGMTFPEFMQREVFGPIGMTHTMVRSDRHGTVPGATEGYTRGANGEWRTLGDLPASMGAGAIYTTLGDLQRWVENYAHPRVGTAASIAQMMTPFTLTTGKSTGYGMGLFVDTQGPLKRIQHGGADVAHRSMLAYYPEIDAGVTVQSNDAGFDSQMAFRIAQAFFAELTPAPKPKVAGAAASFDPARFDEFVGRYALDAAPQFVMSFTRSADSLFTQATGQSRLQLTATSDSTFAIRGVEASVTFLRDAQRKVVGLTLNQNGVQRATRLAGDAPKAWAPTAVELNAFAGRFFSEELEAYYTISVKDGVLIVENRRSSAVKMAPGAKDTFVVDATTLIFERDRNGQVIGFYAGNTRTRDVRFARVR
jgi:CubicO group peptidase (beta-lactamase class C family)